MADPAGTPTTHAIVKAVRASLTLVSSSLELLTMSQLFAVKRDLCETMAIIKGQIQARQSSTLAENVLKYFATNSHSIDDQKFVISDWEDSLDEDKNKDGDAPIGEYYPLSDLATAVSQEW